jgi:hypothetical protein
MEMETA